MIIGTPYSKGAGYFVNDVAKKNRQEADVRTCTHCQQVIFMQQWKEAGAWCGRCFAPICNNCGVIAQTQGCVPFMKKLEQYAEATMRYQQISKIAGLEPEPQKSIITGA